MGGSGEEGGQGGSGVAVAAGAVEGEAIKGEAGVIAAAGEGIELADVFVGGVYGEDGGGLPRCALGEVDAIAAEEGEAGTVDGPGGAIEAAGVGASGDVDGIAGLGDAEGEVGVVEGFLL